MPLRPAILGLVVAAWAGAALAAEPTLKDAAQCQKAPDLAVCLLDFAGQSSFVRSSLSSHGELRREQPQLFARLNPPSKLSEGDAAIDATLAAYKAGRSPNQALAAIEALDDREPPSGIWASFKPSSPRLTAYTGLWNALVGTSHPLAQAALQGWERELAKVGGRADPAFGVEALVKAYAKIGDIAGARRAMLLDAPLDSAREISRLVQMGDVEGAAAASRVGTITSVEAAVKRESAPYEAVGNAFQSLYERVHADLAAAELQRMRAEGRSQDAAALESALKEGKAENLPQDLQAYFQEGVREEARDRLNSSRLDLLMAARSTRPDIARQAADAYMGGGGSIDLQRPELRILIQAASPKSAEAWLEAQEAQIGKDVPTEMVAITPSHLYLSLTGWRALGRDDRVQALLDRWMPQARTEATRYRLDPAAPAQIASEIAEFLANEDRIGEATALAPYVSNLLWWDISLGRGLANLDLYLAKADPYDLFIACQESASSSRDYQLVEACLRRGLTQSRDPAERQEYARRALGMAAQAERQGQPKQALQLWNLAANAALEPGAEPWPLWTNSPYLVYVAKAALRLDGRLKRPIE